MKTKLSKKRAIAIVLTTVIILVASVILGAGVVIYGSSLFQEKTLIEEIKVSGTKLWVHASDATGIAWGATTVRNSGDKPITLNQITVRGSEVSFNQWYVDTTLTTAEFSAALNHTGWVNSPPSSGGPSMLKLGTCSSNNSYLCIDQDSAGGGTAIISANATTGSVRINTGDTAVIYFKVNNGTITPFDLGGQFTVSISAGKAISFHAIVVKGIS